MPCQKYQLTQCCNSKQLKSINDIAKVIIKTEKITSFGGLFFVLNKIDIFFLFLIRF